MKAIIFAVAIFALGVVSFDPAVAQSTNCSDVRSQVLRDAATRRQILRSRTLSRCPQVLAEIVASMPTYPTDPEEVWELVVETTSVIDKSIFDQALAVVPNRSAATIHRAGGIIVLASLAGNSLSYYSGTDIITGPILLTTPLDPAKGCANALSIIHPERPQGAQPLPSNYLRQAAQVLDPIAVDPTEPLLLRRLAECARPVGWDVPPQINISGVQVTYVCGNRFRVSNPTARRLPFRVEVVGAQESKDFWVKPNGDQLLITDAAGTVNLYYDGQLAKTAANGGASCS